MELNNKIATVLLESLTLEELEAIVERKKKEIKFIVEPKVLTESERTKNYCRKLLLKKLHPPKFK